MSTFVTYNGVTLQMCEVIDYTREVEKDGPIYLWTNHRLHVRGVYNPQATAYVNNDGTPRMTLGTSPAVTDAALWAQLAQPFKALIFQVGNDIILRAPSAGYSYDAQNGPSPTVISVTEILGPRTFLVEFMVEARVVGCRGASPPTILSHRWTATEEIAQPNYLSVRTIAGHLILRSDFRQQNDTAPDDFRPSAFHPCPNGFQREDVVVTADESDTRIDYSFVDRQLGIDYGSLSISRQVSRIEAFHTSEVTKPSFQELLGSPFRGGAQGAGVVAGMAGPGAVNPLGLITAGLAGGVGAGVSAYNTIPSKVHTVIARAWGNRYARRRDLEEVAATICLRRMQDSSAQFFVGNLWTQVSHDLMNKFVEVQMRYKQGLERLGALAVTGFNLPGIAVGVGSMALGPQSATQLNLVPATEEVPTVVTNATSANPRLPTSSNTRAAGIRVVAQALHNACALPPTARLTSTASSNDRNFV